LRPLFVDRMPTESDWQDHGVRHTPTTPFAGRYVESGLEDICSAIDVSMNVPAAAPLIDVAGATGFEPAISAVTGPHVRPLHHAPGYSPFSWEGEDGSVS